MKCNIFFKFILILFIISICFTSTFCYASGTAFDRDTLSIYTFKADESYIDLSASIEEAKNNPEVLSGSKYYFVYSFLNGDNLQSSIAYASKTNSSFNHDLVFYIRSYNAPYLQFDIYRGARVFITVTAVYDSDTRTLITPFATNFPYNIYILDENSNENYLIRNSPYIADNDDTLSRLNGDYFLIFPNNSANVNLNFSICQTEHISEGGLEYDRETVLGSVELNSDSEYYKCPTGDEVWYEVPYSAFEGIEISEGEIYNYRLQYDLNGETLYVNRNITSLVNFSFSGGESVGEGDNLQNAINSSTNAIIDSNKQTQNAIENQTEAIQENTETNKGIWETLKEVLSYINPFSENFFVYKLIDLLIEGLKTLFIPSDDFFSTYFEDLRDWFSDRLGFLWTPFDVIIEILEDISSINFSEPIISVPDIYEPFTNTKLISAFSYNLNSLLDNSTFNTVHSIYLICVDAIIIFAMIHLTHKKIEEVFSN